METKESLFVTLVQAHLAWEDREANFSSIEKLLKQNVKETDIIVLPEMFSTGFSMNATALADVPGGTTYKWMSEIAGHYDAVVCGSVIVIEDDYYYNRFIWMQPTGEWSCYDKRHLFRMGDENKIFTAGEKRKVVTWRGWNICPLICYDLRFPVWGRNRNDYDLLIYVANWPAARDEVWQTLLKARAIENQCYVAGVNRVGADGRDIIYSGNSLLIDPRGTPVANAGYNNQCVITGKLNKQALTDFRNKFPVHLDADKFSIE